MENNNFELGRKKAEETIESLYKIANASNTQEEAEKKLSDLLAGFISESVLYVSTLKNKEEARKIIDFSVSNFNKAFGEESSSESLNEIKEKIRKVNSAFGKKLKLERSVSAKETEESMYVWSLKQKIAFELGFLDKNKIALLKQSKFDFSLSEKERNNFLDTIPTIFSADMDSENTKTYSMCLLALNKRFNRNLGYLEGQSKEEIALYDECLSDFLVGE